MVDAVDQMQFHRWLRQAHETESLLEIADPVACAVRDEDRPRRSLAITSSSRNMKKLTAVSPLNRISELFEARLFCNSVGILQMSTRRIIIDSRQDPSRSQKRKRVCSTGDQRIHSRIALTG